MSDHDIMAAAVGGIAMLALIVAVFALPKLAGHIGLKLFKRHEHGAGGYHDARSCRRCFSHKLAGTIR